MTQVLSPCFFPMENVIQDYIWGSRTAISELLGINNPEDDTSIFFPRWDTVQVPESVGATSLHLAYQVKAPKIASNAIPLDTEVDLPDALLEPLLAYVSSRINSSRGSTEGIQEGMAQMNKYELLCMQLKNANILNNSEQITNCKLEARGWR